MERLTIGIEGMSCGHCVRAVTEALREIEGVEVERVEVGSATVGYDPARVAPDAILAAVDDLGYQAHAAAAR
jgi:copper chaperone